MKSKLIKKNTELYFFEDGNKIVVDLDENGIALNIDKVISDCPGLYGDCSDLEGDFVGLSGDCTGLYGDCNDIYGDCTGLSGDCTEIHGDCTGIFGNLDECEITESDRIEGIYIYDLISKT